MNSIDKPGIGLVLRPTDRKKTVTKVADAYLKFYGDSCNKSPSAISNGDVADVGTSKQLADCYYDLATDFFEYGWGESFHFATMNKGESREHAFAKHEYKLALKLELKAGGEVLDIGCGVGGPARHIAAFSDAKIIGLNINDYQLSRAKELTRKSKLDHLCSFVKGDFCNAPFPSESFSKVYAIEATCHASDDLSRVYGEVYRLLKPGGLFACYEWIMTDKYNPHDPYHKKIKADILIGDGLPDLQTSATVLKCLESVGFEVVEADDLALKSPVPWYAVLQPKWTISDIKITPFGRWATQMLLVTMETMRLAPKGASKVHSTLCRGADGLVLGGKEGIFSPMYMFIARKPEKPA